MNEAITSRDNPLVKQIRALAQDPGAYRKLGQVWLEGDHLCRALLARGAQPAVVVTTAAAQHLPDAWGLAPGVRRVLPFRPRVLRVQFQVRSSSSGVVGCCRQLAGVL